MCRTRFRNIILRLLLLHLGLVVGCNNQSPRTPPGAVTNQSQTTAGQLNESTDPDVPTRANPKLQTIDLYVGPHVLKTELALTEVQIQTGMMFRQSIGEDEAMLFVFSSPHRAAFWMKNVDIPLDGAYIDPSGEILEIIDMKPHEERSIVAQSARVQYVLETQHGWFERNGVGPGTLITTELGTLRETFFRQPR